MPPQAHRANNRPTGFDHSTVRGHAKHFGLHALYHFLLAGVVWVIGHIFDVVFNRVFDVAIEAMA